MERLLDIHETYVTLSFRSCLIYNFDAWSLFLVLPGISTFFPYQLTQVQLPPDHCHFLPCMIGFLLWMLLEGFGTAVHAQLWPEHRLNPNPPQPAIQMFSPIVTRWNWMHHVERKWGPNMLWWERGWEGSIAEEKMPLLHVISWYLLKEKKL